MRSNRTEPMLMEVVKIKGRLVKKEMSSGSTVRISIVSRNQQVYRGRLDR